MGYEYNPQPGAPLDPSKYNGAVGPNGLRYGEQQGFVYNPVTDKYDPKPKDDKKQGLGSYIGPVAAGAGAIAAGTLLGDPTKWPGVGTAVSDSVSGIGNVFGLGGSAAPAAAPAAASAAAPAAASAAAPFALGAAPAAGAVPAAPTLVSATATPTAAAAPGMFAPGGAALQAAGVAAGAYTGYQQFKGAENALKGKDLDFQQQAALALPTFGLSFAANPINKFFGSTKGDAQQKRDALREQWKAQGLIDEQYNIYNVDGSPFNVGLDGGGKINGDQRPYDVNLDDPTAVSLIPMADVLAALTGAAGDKKLTSHGAGYIVNAAMASGDPMQNLMSYFQKAGLDHDKAYGMIHEMSLGGGKDGKPLLSKELADSYKNSLDFANKRGAYANGANPQPSAPVVQAPSPQVAAPAPAAAPRPSPQGAAPPVNVAAPQAAKPKPIVRGLGQR